MDCSSAFCTWPSREQAGSEALPGFHNKGLFDGTTMTNLVPFAVVVELYWRIWPTWSTARSRYWTSMHHCPPVVSIRLVQGRELFEFNPEAMLDKHSDEQPSHLVGEANTIRLYIADG